MGWWGKDTEKRNQDGAGRKKDWRKHFWRIEIIWWTIWYGYLIIFWEMKFPIWQESKQVVINWKGLTFNWIEEMFFLVTKSPNNVIFLLTLIQTGKKNFQSVNCFIFLPLPDWKQWNICQRSDIPLRFRVICWLSVTELANNSPHQTKPLHFYSFLEFRIFVSSPTYSTLWLTVVLVMPVA